MREWRNEYLVNKLYHQFYSIVGNPWYAIDINWSMPLALVLGELRRGVQL